MPCFIITANFQEENELAVGKLGEGRRPKKGFKAVVSIRRQPQVAGKGGAKAGKDTHGTA